MSGNNREVCLGRAVPGRGFILSRAEDRRQRTCLMCERVFDSLGPQNRRCPRCEKSASAMLSDARVVRVAASDGRVVRKGLST